MSDPIQGLPISTTDWTGVSFTTDGQAYTLDQIVGHFRLIGLEGGESITGRLYYGDVNGLPTTLYSGASFTHSSLSVGDIDVTFSATSEIILSANTNYVFVVSGSVLSGDDVVIGWIATPASEGYYTDVPGSSWGMPAAVAYSTDAGFSFFDAGGGGWRNIGSIYATPIPEPSTYLLLGSSALGALCLRRRRVS